MSIGRIELSRIPVSVMAFLIIMSIAPLLVEAFMPYINVTDYYYSIQVTDDALNFFRNLAQEGGIVGDIGALFYGSSLALRGILMIAENLILGGYPVWKMIGLDYTFPNGFNLAYALAGLMDLLLIIMLFKVLHGGLRI